MKKNVGTMERVAAVAAGTALVTIALRKRRWHGAASLTGAALVLRGLSGYCPVYDAAGLSTRDSLLPAPEPLSRHRSITASVTIDRPAGEVFEYWRETDHLPGFIHGLERVERNGDSLTMWEFHSTQAVGCDWLELPTPQDNSYEIRWAVRSNGAVRTTGTVLFRDVSRGGCEVTVKAEYDQAGGAAGEAVLWLLGRTPAGRLREDLRRLKSLLETGEIPVGAEPSGKRSLKYRAVKAVTA
jgi:uncharacterized membrane protein